jgi:hypothetical protein
VPSADARASAAHGVGLVGGGAEAGEEESLVHAADAIAVKTQNAVNAEVVFTVGSYASPRRAVQLGALSSARLRRRGR